MKDEGAPKSASPTSPAPSLHLIHDGAGRSSRSMSARVTGLQAAHASLAAQLDLFAAQFSPREFAVLLDLLSRVLERERRRHARAIRSGPRDLEGHSP